MELSLGAGWLPTYEFYSLFFLSLYWLYTLRSSTLWVVIPCPGSGYWHSYFRVESLIPYPYSYYLTYLLSY